MATTEQWQRIDKQAENLVMMDLNERLELIKNLLNLCDNHKQQAVLIMFYIYGLRPVELMQLTPAHFVIIEIEGDEVLRVRLPTAKGGSQRIIDLNVDTPFLSIVIEYVKKCHVNTWEIFREYNTPTALNNLLLKLEKKYAEQYGEDVCLAPYVFRKFRESELVSLQASTGELLAWKGGKSFKVVEKSYLKGLKPVSRFRKSIR